MRKYALILAVFLALAGCSHSYHPLEIAKKKRLVSELILTAPQCYGFRERLASPAVDDDGVDAVFHAAMHAHCIKKDI